MIKFTQAADSLGYVLGQDLYIMKKRLIAENGTPFKLNAICRKGLKPLKEKTYGINQVTKLTQASPDLGFVLGRPLINGVGSI